MYKSVLKKYKLMLEFDIEELDLQLIYATALHSEKCLLRHEFDNLNRKPLILTCI